MHAVTTPPEWRRRSVGLVEPRFDGAVAAHDLRSAGAGLAALADGDMTVVREAARACRGVVWAQPQDLRGVRAAPDLDVLAHAGPQAFAVLGRAVGFLADCFEVEGDDADLESALELHDLTVALGDDVWEGPDAWWVGWGASRLFEVTGSEAVRATIERVADAMCETQLGDGGWPEGDGPTGRWVLGAMADAVEARDGVPGDEDSPEA